MAVHPITCAIMANLMAGSFHIRFLRLRCRVSMIPPVVVDSTWPVAVSLRLPPYLPVWWSGLDPPGRASRCRSTVSPGPALGCPSVPRPRLLNPLQRPFAARSSRGRILPLWGNCWRSWCPIRSGPRYLGGSVRPWLPRRPSAASFGWLSTLRLPPLSAIPPPILGTHLR